MDARRAKVSVIYNGYTTQIAEYITDFEYVDRASGASDSISVTFIDRDHRWISSWFPKTGDKLQADINLINWTEGKKRVNFKCGEFMVDDFSFSGGRGHRIHHDEGRHNAR